MSPESVPLHRQPLSVAVAAGGLEDSRARITQRREREAFEAGRRAGRDEALAGACVRLDEATARWRDASLAVGESLASDSVELALTIATELVRSEVEHRRHGIEALVRDALAASGVGRGACTVHVGPEDASALASVPFRAGTRIEVDPDVPPACVQVETPQGLLVHDIDTAMASIAARLREEARP